MRTILAAIAAIAVVLGAKAQITVELILDQEQFLRNESLPVRIRLSNFSGQALRIGEDPEWLLFSIEGKDGRSLSRTGEVPLAKPFTLESSKSCSLRADLMPYFNLSEPGHYAVKARVKLKQLDKEFSADAKPFDIISGMKLWEREFGVPGRTPPEVRKYALQQAEFSKNMSLYVRVTDATESKLFRVTALGPIVSFSSETLETRIDMSSNLHVLFQNGRNTFSYSVIEPDGERIVHQTHEQTTTRPHLRVEQDGRVLVSGGQRKFLLSDFPPSRVANTNEKSESK